MEAALAGRERAHGHLRPPLVSVLTGEMGLPLPGPAISHPQGPGGILSTVLQSELKPLVLRLELISCNVSLFTEWALKQECSSC